MEEMALKGTVSGIIFRNEDNGYTVLSLETTDGDTITCVGNFATLSVGAVLNVSGKVSDKISVSSTSLKRCEPDLNRR